MVDGKSEAITTKELSGGARIHHIFQSIFVKSLEVQIFVPQLVSVAAGLSWTSFSSEGLKPILL